MIYKEIKFGSISRWVAEPENWEELAEAISGYECFYKEDPNREPDTKEVEEILKLMNG